ncbi:hypothetical protein EIK56_22995 [Sphingomonas sp. C8-2]|nr:hypothetical protein EIK56_22995 [Sphingomonas sp. C8-2]
MTIQFLQDYETKAIPPEAFTLGQVVEDRDAASEAHFVNRGYAAYLVNGKLIDRFGKEVEQPRSADDEADEGEGGDDLYYERDQLGEIDVSKANKPQLLAIAKHEEVELPKGDATSVKDLREAILAKRAA